MAQDPSSKSSRTSTMSKTIAVKALTEERNRLKRITTQETDTEEIKRYLIECLDVSIHLLQSEHF